MRKILLAKYISKKTVIGTVAENAMLLIIQIIRTAIVLSPKLINIKAYDNAT